MWCSRPATRKVTQPLSSMRSWRFTAFIALASRWRLHILL